MGSIMKTMVEWNKEPVYLDYNERTTSKCGTWEVVRFGRTLVFTQYRYVSAANEWEAFYSLAIPRGEL